MVGPGDHAELPGDAETALRPGLLPLLKKNLRIDELHDLVVIVDHEHRAAQDTHLGRGQARPLGFLQGVGHVVQQLVEPRVEFRHRAALLC